MTDAPTSATPSLFCFGLGYTAIALARLVLPLGWTGEWVIHTQMRKLYVLSAAPDT